MKKRLLAAIMSLCMVVSLLPVSAFANELTSDAPGAVAANKRAIDNGNGTYTITLSVESNPITQATKSAADVVLVVDNSGSMTNRPTSWGVCGDTNIT